MKGLQYIKNEIAGFRPGIGLVLGSGLGRFADDRIAAHKVIPYSDIPGFPLSTVEGHEGNLIFGQSGGQEIVCMQGRAHIYEGYSMEEIVRPIRAMASLGVRELILTNSAGGIREDLLPGSLMLIADHINFMGGSPSAAGAEQSCPQFTDLTNAYDAGIRDVARKISLSGGADLKEGVYLAVTGPAFETPAEIRAFRAMGADAVGMSTVPEVIAAVQMGIRVCGLSCITNLAAGVSDEPVSHRSVTEKADSTVERFSDLVEGIFGAIETQ